MTLQKVFQVTVDKYNASKLIASYSISTLDTYPDENDLFSIAQTINSQHPENENLKTFITVKETYKLTL